MNMKKTIAAVSAAAVAMSAIAATVSADDTATTQGSFTYDLVREKTTLEEGNATITYQATGLNLVDSNFLTIELGNIFAAADSTGIKWENSAITVTVKNPDTNKTVSWNLNTANDADFYSTWIKYKSNFAGLDIVIPVALNSTDGIASSIYDQNIQVDVVVKTKHLVKDDALKKFNTTVDTISAGDAVSAPFGVDCTISAASAYNTTTYVATVMAAPTTSVALDDANYNLALFDASTGGTITLANGRVYTVPTVPPTGYVTTLATYQDYIDDIDAVVSGLAVSGGITQAAVLATPIPAGDATDAPWAAICADASLPTILDNAGDVEVGGVAATYGQVRTAITTAISTINSTVTTYTNARTPLVTAVTTATANLSGTRSTDVQARFSEVTNAGEKTHLFPMMTTAYGIAQPGTETAATKGQNLYTYNNYASSSRTYWDLIDYLELDENKLNARGSVGYKNILPLINDTIAANESVTFQFKTSALYINAQTTGKMDANLAQKTDDYYGEGFTSKKDDYWYNPSFGQHLYNKGYYGSEGTGFYGTGDYTGWAFNLFTGGLTVNSTYTMTLSDSEAYDWTADSLIFDWESVSKGKVTNAYLLVQTMNLYTSTNWFWDSFTVAFSNDAEDVSSGEGDDAVEDVIEDEVVEDEVVEDEVVEDEVVEDVEDVEVVEAVEENVPTGNAPIALAVIPVALAAAAIVAKKRG